MPRSLSIAATGFSVIGILALPAVTLMLGTPTLQAAADELAERNAAAASAAGAPDSAVAGSYDRSFSGIDRMMLPPGWSVLPEGTWPAASHSPTEQPSTSAWKEIRGEMPAGWTGAGSLAGSSAPPPPSSARFVPAEPGSADGGAGTGWSSRFSLPSAASGR
ncbi:MAG TPA: hypothetical protein VGD08_17170 [Stellaceae bacterium]